LSSIVSAASQSGHNFRKPSPRIALEELGTILGADENPNFCEHDQKEIFPFLDVELTSISIHIEYPLFVSEFRIRYE